MESEITWKILSSALLSSTIAGGALAADFGNLAGAYSGKTEKGSAVVFSTPKSGTPAYRFKGEQISVSSVGVSGKSIMMRVRSGGGKITPTSTGKASMSMQYSFKADKASANPTKR